MLLKNIAQIIKDYMELDSSQIWLKNQKAPLQKDKSLSVTVGYMGLSRTIGISKTNIDGVETSSITQYNTVTIDIFGNTDDVVERKEEIIMALNSSQSLESQAKNGFMISRHALNFNDISGIDGAAIPYRFQLVFSVHFTKSKTSKTDYYDNFENETKIN